MFAKSQHKHIDVTPETPLLSLLNWIGMLGIVLIFNWEWGKGGLQNYCFNGLIKVTFY